MEDKSEQERRLTIRLPDWVLADLRILGKHHGRSLNGEVLWALKSYVLEDVVMKNQMQMEKDRQTIQRVVQAVEDGQEMVTQMRAALEELREEVRGNGGMND